MRKHLTALAVASAVVLIGGCSSSTSSEPPSTPTPLTIRGTVTLKAPATVSGVTDGGFGDCRGLNGYDDMAPGADVVAKDQGGVIVGKGAITGSTWTDEFHRGCAFAWTVTVPTAGTTFYQLEIGTRPAYIVSVAEAAKPISLTLG